MSTLLSDKLAELGNDGVAENIRAAFAEHIQTAPPAQLMRMGAFQFAERRGLPQFDTLDAFLYGTRLGIFDLEWDIRCPSCTGSTQLSSHLDRLKRESRCGYCRIDFAGGFDDAVEIMFRVNANVRDIGNPPLNEVVAARNVLTPPQVVAVKPGDVTSVDVDLVPGTWHLFDASFDAAAPLWVKGETITGGREISFLLDPTADYALSRGEAERRPGPATLRIESRASEPHELYLARALEQPWVSGAVVASNQIFRDYFSSELIDPDESFAVRNMTFVFTDIKGSTEMYERRGDSRAYALVREHFRILARVIAEHRGGIVKTIGDAVMATFPVGLDAFAAVLDMHRAFAAFNENRTGDEIQIKIGLHRGPCLAVCSNERIDYFGRTVNMAARIQGLSAGGDVVLSASAADEGPIREAMSAVGWRVQPFAAELKGIAERCDVLRLRP